MSQCMSIEREQLVRVLKAPGLPLAPQVKQDDLLDLLSWVTDAVWKLILAIPIVDAQDISARAIKKSIDELEATLNAFPGEIGPKPPAIPAEWNSKMENWSRLMVSFRKLGNPSRPQRNALLLLCAYYRLAFDREPSATDKPTRDFINLWFVEFGSEMEKATALIRPGDKRKLRSKVWLPPQDEALRKALQQYLSDPEIDQQVQSRHADIVSFRAIKETIHPQNA